MEQPVSPRPNNHLALAIVTTVLCCVPFGIVAIVQASKVNRLYSEENYEAANRASASAKKWSIIGMIVGGIFGIIYVAYCVLVGFAVANGGY